jgi:WD40 repeat protein
MSAPTCQIMPPRTASRSLDTILVFEQLPTEILCEHIAPFLDRVTINNLSLANKEIRFIVKKTNPKLPWPTTTLSVGEACLQSGAFSHDNSMLACLDTKGVIHVWNTGNGERRTLALPPWMLTTCLAFSRTKKKLLATGSREGVIRLWDPSNQNPIQSNQFTTLTCCYSCTSNQEEYVHCLAFSPDGKMLAAAAGFSGDIHIFDARTGRKLRKQLSSSMRDKTSRWESLVFSPDSKYLAVGGKWNEFRVFDLSSSFDVYSTRLNENIGSFDETSRVSFSRDGKYVISVESKSVRYHSVFDCSCARVISVVRDDEKSAGGGAVLGGGSECCKRVVPNTGNKFELWSAPRCPSGDRLAGRVPFWRPKDNDILAQESTSKTGDYPHVTILSADRGVVATLDSPGFVKVHSLYLQESSR